MLVRRVPVLKHFHDLADPEPRPDAWCRLYAAVSWEELGELLEGKFAALIQRAREVEGADGQAIGSLR